MIQALLVILVGAAVMLRPELMADHHPEGQHRRGQQSSLRDQCAINPHPLLLQLPYDRCITGINPIPGSGRANHVLSVVFKPGAGAVLTPLQRQTDFSILKEPLSLLVLFFLFIVLQFLTM